MVQQRRDASRPKLGPPFLVEKLGLTGEIGAQLQLYARRMVLAHNRTEQSGSYSLALRLTAAHPLAPEAFRRWVAARKDRHSIPPSIREWMHVSGHTQRYHRNPTEASLRGVYCPNTLRMNHRTGERLRAGERFSADDGSVNFVVMVPWKTGGCPCSEKYDVKVGRFQLLVLHDDATGYVPHFTWIARESQSYRAEDIASFMHGAFARLGCWETAMLEQGSWASHRIDELLALAQIERETAYEAPQKLVEGWWNRAWTLLSTLPGQIGRYRGEEERAAALVEKYRAGSADPRGELLYLSDAANAVSRVVAELNQRRIESGPLFGSWVPADRWKADLAAKPLRRLPADSEPLARPERRVLQVRKMMVHAKAKNIFGETHEYKFFDEALIAHEGRRVLVYFDPHDDPCTAAIYTADGRKLIAPRAVNLTPTPALVCDGGQFREDWDLGYLARAQAAKSAARAAVRREHRTIAPDGKLEAWSTEVRNALERSKTEMQRSAGTADLPPPAHTRESVTVAPRATAPARPDPTADDLAEIEALEQRARARGAIPIY